jgi:hypothetical protein
MLLTKELLLYKSQTEFSFLHSYEAVSDFQLLLASGDFESAC